jgi:hypothetical protein
MALPPLYARWLEELHGAPPPEEPRATCSSCPMTRELLQEHRFTTQTKCCTFFPEMTSFGVGGVLLDEHPGMAEGKKRLLARIAAGQQVTPLGVTRPGIFLRLYGRGETFGIQPALRCPFYIEEGGLCGVWRHRESTCATWFCKHERGVLGFQFWTAQRRLLKAVEKGLSTVVAIDLGIERDALDLLLTSTDTIDKEQEPGLYNGIWGDWLGRETAYYAECARRVAAMSWADVVARAEGELEGKIHEAREVWTQLAEAPPLPELVRIRALRTAGGDGKRVLLKTYSGFDPIELAAETVTALGAIDGRSVATIVEEQAAAGVDRALLVKLWEFGLIENASE